MDIKCKICGNNHMEEIIKVKKECINWCYNCGTIHYTGIEKTLNHMRSPQIIRIVGSLRNILNEIDNE